MWSTCAGSVTYPILYGIYIQLGHFQGRAHWKDGSVSAAATDWTPKIGAKSIISTITEAADMAVEAKEEDPNGHVAHVRFNIKAFFFMAGLR